MSLMEPSDNLNESGPGPELGFIVGTGRCGSTLLYNLLAMHPDSNFLTGVLNKSPKAYWLNKSLVWLKHHIKPDWVVEKRPYPSEGWDFWNFHVPGFNAPCRDLVAQDVTRVQKETVMHALNSVRSRRYQHLIIKFTGWTRVGFIKEVYPDSPIVHVVRDPRAVAQSFLQVPWWDGWRGPSQWRWGDLSPEEEKVWRGSGESFIVLAAINWKKVMEAYWTSKQRLPEEQKDSVTERAYSNICENPVGAIEEIRRHFGLPPNEKFLKRVERYDIRTQDEKWRKVFTPGQIERLEAALEDLRWKELMEGKIDPESPIQEVIA